MYKLFSFVLLVGFASARFLINENDNLIKEREPNGRAFGRGGRQTGDIMGNVFPSGFNSMQNLPNTMSNGFNRFMETVGNAPFDMGTRMQNMQDNFSKVVRPFIQDQSDKARFDEAMERLSSSLRDATSNGGWEELMGQFRPQWDRIMSEFGNTFGRNGARYT